ncbi:hypothetical protein HPB47_024802 [Ixodes persulcatus]|uniref:Uncharacterized protein n=1 Tax=Ixodes persulcatus TaxID=34615 RepID=A0AC60Q3X7_IXOPE|nr:hypothetical protein HPB47_024802 [Ixodes persulcatus]
MKSSNPFCFIVQILLCLCSASVWASPFSQVIVSTTLATEGFPVFQDKSNVRFGVLAYWPQYAFTWHKEATPSTSSLINEASKPWNVASSVSGHGNSLRMKSSNPFCFIVQDVSWPLKKTESENDPSTQKTTISDWLVCQRRLLGSQEEVDKNVATKNMDVSAATYEEGLLLSPSRSMTAKTETQSKKESDRNRTQNVELAKIVSKETRRIPLVGTKNFKLS